MKTIQTLVFCFIFCALCGQNSGNSVIDRVQITEEYQYETLFVDSAFIQISDAVLVNAGISLQIGNPYNSFQISSNFLVQGDEVYPFESHEQFFQSPQFVASIRPDFRLKSNEDGLKFQSFLYLVDQNSFHKGFFRDNNDWYFIRREFFDEYRGWKVSTHVDGKIISVEYNDELVLEMPNELQEASNQTHYYNQPPVPNISGKAHQAMKQYAQAQLNYSLEERRVETARTENISRAVFTELSVLLTSQYEDYTYTEKQPLWVLEYGQRLEVFFLIHEVLTSPLFLESLQPGFSLKEDKDALSFEIFLDAISDYERSEKQLIRKDDRWFFIRSKFFDDAVGFVVKTNDQGKIQSLSYDERIDVDAPEEVPFDETTADWGFQLVEPQANKVAVIEGATVYVQISFNETPVNLMGAWILTRVNGENQGMVAGTEMYSPFTDEINGSYLGVGTHTIEYMLLRPGMDPENPLATVTMEVEVKTFNPVGIDWELMLMEPDQTDFAAESGVSIPVQISYNQQAVQDNGVHMLISYKGEIVGGEKPEHMDSPFIASIPGAVLTQGMHQISFLLMPPGSEDPEMALDKITFNVEVK
jgi:hypothetical protein